MAQARGQVRLGFVGGHRPAGQPAFGYFRLLTLQNSRSVMALSHRRPSGGKRLGLQPRWR